MVLRPYMIWGSIQALRLLVSRI